MTCNITYYPVFQNIRNILQQLHILLTPGKEHKKVFQDIPVVRFHDGKSLEDYLVRAKLPNVEITGKSESCSKENCHVCDFICNTDTFTTKACGETFKIKSWALNCNSKKVVYLLKCRIFGEACYVVKAKTKFRAISIIIKAHTGPIEKIVKYHSNVFMNIMDNTVTMGLMIGSSNN